MAIYLFIISLFLAAFLASFVLFDLLVRREYAEHKRNWIADGRPRGFVFWPIEAFSSSDWAIQIRSSIASQRCGLKWVYSTPDWVRHDARARALLRWYRSAVLFLNFGWAAIIIALIFVQ